MRKTLLILTISLITVSCTKSNKNYVQKEITKTELKQVEITQSENLSSLYKHILDIGDDIQIMSDSNNQVLITKFIENKQIVIICDEDNSRYMSQRHCKDSIIDLFVENCKEFDKKIEWIEILDYGANKYAQKIVEEYDEYYKKTFTRVYTTYEALYGWLNT